MSQCGQDTNADLADVIANPLPSLPALPPSTGVGDVTDIDPNTGLIGIRPGGSGVVVQVPWITPYQPQIGDLAYLVKQGGQWLALGALSTRSVGGYNEGLDPDSSQAGWSFETYSNVDPITAAGWTWEDTSDPASGYVEPPLIVSSLDLFYSYGNPVPHGDNFINIQWVQTGVGGGGISIRLLSPPIPMVAGEQWTTSVSVRGIAYQSPANIQESTGGVGMDYSNTQTDAGAYTNLGGVGPWQLVQSRVRRVPTSLGTPVVSGQVGIAFSAYLTSGSGASGYFMFDNVRFRKV